MTPGLICGLPLLPCVEMIHRVHYINEEGEKKKRKKKGDSSPQQGEGEKCKFSPLLPQTCIPTARI